LVYETQRTIRTNSNCSSPYEFGLLTESESDVEDDGNPVDEDHQTAGKSKSKNGKRKQEKKGWNGNWKELCHLVDVVDTICHHLPF